MKVPEGFLFKDHGSSLVVLRQDVAADLEPLLVTPPWKDRERFAGARYFSGRGTLPSVRR